MILLLIQYLKKNVMLNDLGTLFHQYYHIYLSQMLSEAFKQTLAL